MSILLNYTRDILVQLQGIIKLASYFYNTDQIEKAKYIILDKYIEIPAEKRKKKIKIELILVQIE